MYKEFSGRVNKVITKCLKEFILNFLRFFDSLRMTRIEGFTFKLITNN